MKNLFDKLLLMVVAVGVSLLARAAAPTMFVDSLELKVGSIKAAQNSDETKRFEGLPVLVKVFESDEKFPGFLISRSGGVDGDGSDIRFSQNGEILPHEMVSPEKDENGKITGFTFWVRVPVVTAGSTITMHWGVKDGLRPPANRPSLVWSDYVGVWHESAPGDKSVKDASGNGLDAVLEGDYLMVPARYWGLISSTDEKRFSFTASYKAKEDMTAPAAGNNYDAASHLFGSWSKTSHTGWGGSFYDANRFRFHITWIDPTTGAYGDDVINHSNMPHTIFTWNRMEYTVADGEVKPEVTVSFRDDVWKPYSGDSYHYNQLCFVPNEEPMILSNGNYYMKEARLSKNPLPADRIQEEYSAMSDENYVTLADGAQHIVAEGENYWVREPSLSPLAWSDPTKVVLNVGQAKFGGPSPTSYSVQNAAGTKTFSGGFADIADPEKNPAGFGAYRVVIKTGGFDNEGNPIKQLQKIIYFAYVSEVKSQELRDNQTMLFNDIAGNDKISGQGFGYEGSFWSYDEVDSQHLVNSVYGWKIRYGTIGNARMRDAVGSALDVKKNYLPCGASTGALVWNNPAQEAKDLIDAGSAILYNQSESSDPAAIYSPIYEKGVGEIYFDAVNMDCEYMNRLELQYLTLSHLREVSRNENIQLSDVSPSDWFVYKETAKLDILSIKKGEKTSQWTNSSYVPLMMLANGSAANTSSFYRVRVRLNVAEPVIFRIARTDSSWGAGGLTGPGNILVDNILVSDPTTVVKLQRLEDTWDPNRDFGKYLHGDRGTLSKRFPKVGDSGVRAKVCVSYEGFGSDNLETRVKNVAALIFKYRRRYLNANLGEKGEWKSVRMEFESDDPELGSIFMTPASEPLDLGVVGETPFDVEYSFEYTPNPTSYDYVDYFGLEDCSFEAVAMDDAETLPYSGKKEGITRTPTLGNDFFFRLREGASDYEQMEVLWRFLDERDASSSVVTNNLRLIDDHLWTGAITVTNANARFGFKMRGVNNKNGTWNSWRFQDVNVKADDSYHCETKSPYSVISEQKLDDEVEPEFKNIAAEVVQNTRQFIIRFNDETGAFSLCRGDYQDFNHWTDAAANTNGLFVAHSGQVGNDGQNVNTDAIANSILQRRFPGDPSKNVFEDWEENVSTDPLWQEKFDSVYNSDEAARTGKLLGTSTGERTPNNGWVGRNFMYVNESLNNLFSSSYNSRAALLEGKGRGSLECDETTRYPDGIGEINFEARLGQQHTFDRVSTYSPSEPGFEDFDYLVSTRLVMSSLAKSAADLGFDGQGTASIFAYYSENGSYEFRMKRISRVKLAVGLYRWYQERGSSSMKVKELAYWECNSTGSESNTSGSQVPATALCTQPLAEGTNTTAYVAFFGVKKIVDDQGAYVGSQLYAGFTNNNGSGETNNRPSVADDIAGRDMTWNTIRFQDKGFNDTKGNRVNFLKHGTFGFLSTDCPARFMRPMIHAALPKEVAGWNQTYVDKIALPEVKLDLTKAGTASEDDFWDNWKVAQFADIGKWTVTGKNYYGIVTPEVSQQIVISTRPTNSVKWTEFMKKTVSSFNYSPISIPAYTTDPTCVRISTYDDGDDDTPRCDVIVDNIEMTQWHATTSENLSGDDFVFTGVWTESVKDVKRAELWPLRVTTDEYQTIRSPFLESGIGAISFSYDLSTLDEHAELDIEYVAGDNVTSYNVANYTDNSRYESEWRKCGEDADAPYRHYDYTELVARGGHITEYLGMRAGSALIRLRVPQKVIEEAHGSGGYGEYGRIDITSIAVWDEPNADERSWTAWNVRVANANTAANEYVAYDKLLNFDSWIDRGGSSGMSMELNNGFIDLAENNPDFYDAHLPYIQSPALITPEDERANLTVGEINFRARKSGDRTDAACVGIYAVKDLSAPDEEMTRIAVTNLTSTAWQNITIKNNEPGVVAIRLVMMDKDEEDNPINSDRALFDELSVTERVDPTVVVTFARPFRSDLNSTGPISTIALPDEQPLCREEFGIQCELALKQLENVIIPESIEVWCDYYIESFYSLRGKWGFDKWNGITDPNKRGTIKLSRAASVGDSSSLIYRMTRHADGTSDYIPPIEDPNTVVQYNFTITFNTTQDDLVHTAMFDPSDPDQWTVPEWYYPADLNKNFTTASAYTIIDEIAPKRAWINEVNVWDSIDYLADGAIDSATNSWVEIAIPSGVDMTGWKLEAVSAINGSNEIQTYQLMTFGENCASSLNVNGPFAFYVVANELSSVAHNAVMEIPTSFDYKEQIFFGGHFSYYMPVALRLVRPTGIVDHEVLVGPCDEMYDLERVYEYFVDGETGHNKTVIAAMDNYKDFDAQHNSVTVSMLNVADMSSLGVSSVWDNTKTATPGAINIDQTIAEDYLVYPNDNTLRVLSTVRGEGITQDIGNGATRESQLTTVIKDKGQTVTISYQLDPWFEIDKILVNGAVVPADQIIHDGTNCSYTCEPLDNTTIEAVSCTTKELSDLIGEKNPYESAILAWMRKEYPTLKPEDLANNLTEIVDANGNSADPKKYLTLTEMYWIGADPSTPDWKLKFWTAFENPVTYYVDGDLWHKMKLHVEYTNGSDSKKVTSLATKTYGVTSANWKSSEVEVEFDDWTSNGPTLQVTGALQVTSPHGVDLSGTYVPVKCYLLDENSFDDNCERVIDLPDPFGSLSITGKYLDWGEYLDADKPSYRPQIFWTLQLGEREEKLPGYSLDYLR